jgi:hypothetical protein
MRLFLVGCGSLVAAAVLFVVLLVDDLNGYHWPSSAGLPIDGQQHTLALPTDRSTMLWVLDSDPPRCRFTDARSARTLPLRTSTSGYLRSGGTAAHNYIGTHTFNSGSGQVVARCTGIEENGPAHVQPAPRLPASLDDLRWLFLLAQALACAGPALVAVALVRSVLRWRRRVVADHTAPS